MKKYKIAVLDDYQNVALESADWSVLRDRADIAVFRKAQLLKILEADWNARTAAAWKPHPMFGKLTPEEWGKLLLIHVDYHLKQFAA
jgi:hypothetical protein